MDQGEDVNALLVGLIAQADRRTEEVVEAALFLASEASRYVTGAELVRTAA